MPTSFPVVEAMLMPPIHRTQATTLASTTTVHLAPMRAVGELSVQIQVMSAHSEFSPVNSNSILWRVQPSTLVTSASEHNGHSDLGPSDCVASTLNLMCLSVNKAFYLFFHSLIDLFPH